MSKRFTDLIAEALEEVGELFPWDLQAEQAEGRSHLLVDIREPYEFAAMHLAGSINVPRGVLEAACDWGYEETQPDLVRARDRDLILICRSGNRSVLAAQVLGRMGYRKVRSLKTGLKGWSDFELPLVDAQGNRVTQGEADAYFEPKVSKAQLGP